MLLLALQNWYLDQLLLKEYIGINFYGIKEASQINPCFAKSLFKVLS